MLAVGRFLVACSVLFVCACVGGGLVLIAPRSPLKKSYSLNITRFLHFLTAQNGLFSAFMVSMWLLYCDPYAINRKSATLPRHPECAPASIELNIGLPTPKKLQKNTKIQKPPQKNSKKIKKSINTNIYSHKIHSTQHNILAKIINITQKRATYGKQSIKNPRENIFKIEKRAILW